RADHDHHRHRFRAAHLRRGGDRKRLQHPRHWPPDGRCHPGARLSGDPGHDPFDERDLRLRQPAHRHLLHLHRPEDPLLMAAAPQPTSSLQFVLGAVAVPRHWRLGAGPIIAAVVLLLIVIATVFAPLYVPHDPLSMDAVQRLKGPSAEYWIGTDAYGRDLFSRVMIGGQVSLFIGIGAAIVSVFIGLLIGLVSGFFRIADAIIMRIMDSLMAIPSILLAIALV